MSVSPFRDIQTGEPLFKRQKAESPPSIDPDYVVQINDRIQAFEAERVKLMAQLEKAYSDESVTRQAYQKEVDAFLRVSGFNALNDEVQRISKRINRANDELMNKRQQLVQLKYTHQIILRDRLPAQDIERQIEEVQVHIKMISGDIDNGRKVLNEKKNKLNELKNELELKKADLAHTFQLELHPRRIVEIRDRVDACAKEVHKAKQEFALLHAQQSKENTSPMAFTEFDAALQLIKVRRTQTYSLDHLRKNRYRLPFVITPQFPHKELLQLGDRLLKLILNYQEDDAHFDQLTAFLKSREQESIRAICNASFLGWPIPAIVVYHTRSERVLNLLIDFGSDVTVTVAGFNLLHLSVITMPSKPNFPGAIPILIRRGHLDVNAGTVCPPLHLAATNHAVEGFKALLAAGANVNAKDQRNLSTFHYVLADEDSPVLPEILKCDQLDFNAPGGVDGYTALMLATLTGAFNFNIARVLRTHKDKVSYQVHDKNGLTVYDYMKLGAMSRMMREKMMKRIPQQNQAASSKRKIEQKIRLYEL